MKRIVKVLSLIVAPLVTFCAFLTGCKSCKGKAVDIDNGEILQDMDKDPTESAPNQKAYYEEMTKAALAEYHAVADEYYDEDSEEIDRENPEVIKAANVAAGKLFAYACYNERYLDKFVYISHQEGYTDLGSNGHAAAIRQEYFLRINETEETYGYRYHSTIKKVTDSAGVVDIAKSAFESARLRMTDKTDLLYRFEGNSIEIGDYNERLGFNMLKCNWRTGSDWGKPDWNIKKGSVLATDEEIKNDIFASKDDDNRNMRANINSLADDIVKCAHIVESDGLVTVVMVVNTDVANKDEASVKMLTKSNGTDGDCHWIGKEEYDEETGEPVTGVNEDTGLKIIFTLWPSGLFKQYIVIERWQGKMDIPVLSVKGLADSTTIVQYSYSDRDCDMTVYLEMLEEAKKKVEQ